MQKIFFVALFSSLSLGALRLTEMAAYDTVLVNGTLWTGEKTLSRTGVAILNGKVAAIAADGALVKSCVAPCQIVDVQGGFIQPGFHDSHAHLVSGGAQFFRVKVSGSNVNNIAQAVKDYADANPQLEWIRGRGWYAAGFHGQWPTKYDLDKGVSDRPAYLIDSEGHQLWVNSKALELAKITKDTPDPAGGTIVRDANGEPTGMLLENAGDLISEALPETSEPELRGYIEKGQDVGAASGFTAWQGGTSDPMMIGTFQKMAEDGTLKMRTFLWGWLEEKDEDFQKILEAAQKLPQDSMVQVSGFKGFVDGVIGAHTGALLMPYSDKPATSGEPTITQEKLNEYVLRANRAGYPVFLHAVGDKAVHMALDAYELSLNTLHHDLINRIEHIELIQPDDIPRFKKLNVAASVQPAHMDFGSPNGNYYPERLGPDRIRFAFVWHSILQAGGMLTYGTDWPVVGWEPFEGLYCAVHRSQCDGGVFAGSEAINAEEALTAFTVTPAKSIKRDHELGLLKPGYWADITVLSQDPRQTDEDMTSDDVKLLFVNGRQIK